jgi:AraC-like DNA-binding protein
MASRFHYSERHCAPALSPWLWNYWEFRVESDEPGPVPHHVPPDGCTSIALVMSGGVVRHAAASGPWLAPLVVPGTPGVFYWGLRFRPEAGARALGVAPERLDNRNQPLQSLAAELDRSLREHMGGTENFDQAVRAMDRVFLARLGRSSEPDSIARDAVDRLVAGGGEDRIAGLARALDVAPRTLLRRFRAATGLTPKQFARICRFRHAAFKLLDTQRPGWAHVAIGTGFADQAHMIHEFKDLTGLTPEGLGEVLRKTSHGDLIA